MTSPDPLMALADVPRNDIKAARAYYEAHDKSISSEEWRVLYHLQDDPRAFERASKSWTVVD